MPCSSACPPSGSGCPDSPSCPRCWGASLRHGAGCQGGQWSPPLASLQAGGRGLEPAGLNTEGRATRQRDEDGASPERAACSGPTRRCLHACECEPRTLPGVTFKPRASASLQAHNRPRHIAVVEGARRGTGGRLRYARLGRDLLRALTHRFRQGHRACKRAPPLVWPCFAQFLWPAVPRRATAPARQARKQNRAPIPWRRRWQPKRWRPLR